MRRMPTSGLRSASIACATIFSASMSRPESVSSISASDGPNMCIERLKPLLLAAGEAVVHRARDERVVDLEQLHLLLEEPPELRDRHVVLARLRRGARRRTGHRAPRV